MANQALESVPLFEGLNSQDVQLLSENWRSESFSEESVIFAQGDRAEKLYVLISGRVAIRFKPEDGETITVSEIENGGVFGWSAALGRRSYTSCAVCLTDIETLNIRGDDLRKLCETHPETGVIILERLAEVIAERLRNTHAHVVELLRQGMQSTNHG